MKNIDKIRAMSETEMADFLEKVHDLPCVSCCNNYYWCRRNNAPEPICKRHILDWLKEDSDNGA